MADGPFLALQAALVATLKADAAVAALVGARVYDEPPQTPTRPYVRIGRSEGVPLRGDGVATATEVTFSVDVHSRPAQGRVEAARVAEAVIAALDERHDDIAPTGHRLPWVQHQTTAIRREGDGRSYEAVCVFVACLEPT